MGKDCLFKSNQNNFLLVELSNAKEKSTIFRMRLLFRMELSGSWLIFKVTISTVNILTNLGREIYFLIDI